MELIAELLAAKHPGFAVSAAQASRYLTDPSTPLSLLIQLRNPNEAAWNRFVELYTPLLFYWTSRSLFIALLQVLPNFRHDGTHSFRAWLQTALKNKWTDLCRKRARLPAGDVGLSNVAVPSEIIDLEEIEFRV